MAIVAVAAVAVALGKIRSLTARSRDQAMQIEQLQREAAEQAASERAKSEFLATASHELRSPLTSIKGFVELMQSGRDADRLSERQLEFIDIIRRSTDRLAQLVAELLDVARIDADHIELDRRPIDVGEAVREVAELMIPQISAKRQHLGVYVAPTLPLAVADAGRVRQVIANLLTNAHLYTPAGGRIHIGAEADRAWVRLVVADSGVGMTAAETERIFDRFYRAPSGSAAPGTGLGLSIVKSLVDLHDGEIEVVSNPGRGTTFQVRLPAAGYEPGSALEVMRGRRVLVLDDEPHVGELIADQLAPLEVETTVVTDGEAALAALRAERFDAVTVDLLMPSMDGMEVVRGIRDDPELRATPLVFVSVAANRAELAGEWVVAKPIDAEQLRSVLAAAVRAGRSRVLVVAREELQTALEPALDDVGIEYQWETSGAAAARVSGERRFEVALVDVGLRNPEAVLQALALRGRRLQHAVILFSDEASIPPTGIVKLGMDVVPATQAPQALLAALRSDHQRGDRVADVAEN